MRNACASFVSAAVLTSASCASFSAATGDGNIDGGDGDAGSADSSIEDATPRTAGETYRAAVLADGPRDYWRFREPAATVTNETTSARSLVLSPSTRSGTPGLFGELSGALSFDDATSAATSVEVPYAVNDQLTFEGWLYLENELNDVYRTVAHHHRQVGAWAIYVAREAGIGVAFDPGDGSPTRTYVQMSAIVQAKVWHHVVATHGPPLALWVDGTPAGNAGSTGAVPPAGGVFTLGARPGGEPAVQGARLAEVALYDRVLDKERIVAHYTLGVTKR